MLAGAKLEGPRNTRYVVWGEVNFSRDCSSSIWWWFFTDKYGQVPDEEVLSLFFAKYDWAVAGYELCNTIRLVH